jgi:hypothetical protein
MTEITETNKFSPLSAEILTMFYLGETCGSQICVREYPMTGSQMTVFTSYNQIHCWVDQNTMKNIISFSISLICILVFALTFFIPTSGENKAAIVILAMATLVANQIVAILPYTRIANHIDDWLASSPTEDNAWDAFMVFLVTSICFGALSCIKNQIPEAWGWILGAECLISVVCALIIIFWAIPAAQNNYYAHIATERQRMYEIFSAPMEEHQRVLKSLDEGLRELQLIHSMNEWEARQSH